VGSEQLRLADDADVVAPPTHSAACQRRADERAACRARSSVIRVPWA